jgi:hypothetical protein
MIESGVLKYSALVTDVNLKGPKELGDCALGQANRSCISHRLHDGRCRRRLGVGRRAQQHSAAKAVCSCAIGYGGVPVAQQRLADFRLTATSPIGIQRQLLRCKAMSGVGVKPICRCTSRLLSLTY